MKNKLNERDYSIHIPIYRAFSIFLNRYCFFDANKTNSNILLSFQKVAKLMPDLKKCSEKMIKGVFKVFGFVFSLVACELFFAHATGTLMSMAPTLIFIGIGLKILQKKIDNDSAFN